MTLYIKKKAELRLDWSIAKVVKVGTDDFDDFCSTSDFDDFCDWTV